MSWTSYEEPPAGYRRLIPRPLGRCLTVSLWPNLSLDQSFITFRPQGSGHQTSFPTVIVSSLHFSSYQPPYYVREKIVMRLIKRRERKRQSMSLQQPPKIIPQKIGFVAAVNSWRIQSSLRAEFISFCFILLTVGPKVGSG